MRLALVILIAFAGCKKKHQCECSNSNGTYIAGETENTKRKAADYCKSLSGGQTTCYIKE